MGIMHKTYMYAVIVLGFLTVLATWNAYAARSTDKLLHGAKQCTRFFSQYEQKHDIPKHLLAAIATTESGRYHKGLDMPVPWPWTINAEGKGQYFQTKHDAIRAVKRLQASGVKSIDVGCMQVNLHYHADAFSTLVAAFDPKYNVAYAASFLRTHYDETTNWKKATAYYHSRIPSKGSKYVGRVMKKWKHISRKVKEASPRKIAKYKSYIRTSDGKEKQFARSVYETTTPEKVDPREPKPVKAPTAPAKFIKLKQSDRISQNVMVIRPDASTTVDTENISPGNATNAGKAKFISLDKYRRTATPKAEPTKLLWEQ
jgi:hypothetical protein